MIRGGYACIVLALLGGVARAGKPAEVTSETELFQLDAALQQLTLKEEQLLPSATATRTEQALYDSPSTVRVVSAVDINTYGYDDLEEVLHDLPGLDRKS